MSKFPLGQLAATPGALAALERTKQDIMTFVSRHASGDWGDLGDEDKAYNDESLDGSGRIFSAYHLTDGTKIWLITEWDRTVTTCLLPDEY